MGAMGVWCARRPGLWPRLGSWLLPVLPVGVLGISLVLPWESRDWESRQDDLLGALWVYVGAVTLLPWLLGYGVTRLTRLLRTSRERDEGGAS